MSEGRRRQTPPLGQRARSFSLCLSVLFMPPVAWVMPTCIWGGQSLLSLPIRMLISSRNTFMDAPEVIFYHFPGLPLAQASCPIKLTFILPAMPQPFLVTLQPCK